MKQFLLCTLLSVVITVGAQETNLTRDEYIFSKKIYHEMISVEKSPWLYGLSLVEYRDWSKIKKLPKYFASSVSYLNAHFVYNDITPQKVEQYLKCLNTIEKRESSPEELMQYIQSKGDIYFMLLTNQGTNMYDTAEARAYICSPNESHIRIYLIEYKDIEVDVFCICPNSSIFTEFEELYHEDNIVFIEFYQQFVINEAYKRDYERYAKDVAQRLAEEPIDTSVPEIELDSIQRKILGDDFTKNVLELYNYIFKHREMDITKENIVKLTHIKIAPLVWSVKVNGSYYIITYLNGRKSYLNMGDYIANTTPKGIF